MLIERVELHAVRRLAHAEVMPASGFNLFTGANGSGKSSLLEAIHLMAHGRSFRGRVRDGLVRQDAEALQVLLEWRTPGQAGRRAGLRHAGSGWEARMDGERVVHLGALCEALAVVTFEPGSHALVDGSSEHRRRFLDWGLFHVERSDQHGGFLHVWRRHARALKQRNAVLRARRPDPQLDAWEHELAQSGELLTAQREHYVGALEAHLRTLVAALLPAAGDVALSLQPGWRRHELSLEDALLLGRDRDLAQGHTGLGPHRADLRIELRDLPGRQGLSRGQAKLVALSLLLAQAAHLAAHDGHWPVLQLDDLGSELDRDHQRRVLEVLADSGAQVFVTGTEPPSGLAGLALDVARFHVEQGHIAPLA